MVADRIERETHIEAPVERVWTLLTEAEHLGRWFGDAGAEVDLRPGGALTLRWDRGAQVHAVIERVEPPLAVSWRWAPFKDPGGDEPGDGNATLVEFTLAAEDGGTRLRVVESGFAALACSDEQRAANLAGNVEGWEVETGHLVAYAVGAVA